jgi:DNA-binding transcriptional LysR family regulator
MNIRHARYFIATANLGQVSLAAEACNCSRNTMSSAIICLEEELGVKLFVRLYGKGLKLTPVGERLLAEFKAVADAVDNIRAIAKEHTREIRNVA